MQKERLRLQAWFEGRVQGVGFRYKAAEISRGYEVTGFVENLDDGRVHLCAVGEPSEVRAYFKALCEAMSPFIRNISEKEDAFADSYKGFSIKY